MNRILASIAVAAALVITPVAGSFASTPAHPAATHHAVTHHTAKHKVTHHTAKHKTVKHVAAHKAPVKH